MHCILFENLLNRWILDLFIKFVTRIEGMLSSVQMNEKIDLLVSHNFVDFIFDTLIHCQETLSGGKLGDSKNKSEKPSIHLTSP